MPYTRSEMVEAAREAGFRVSARLVTDWTHLGLLDQPQRVPRGRGNGRGALYLWPDNRLGLFLALLGHRRNGSDIVRLCAVPVGTWLLWGDEWVSLAQVKRALRTWAGGWEKHFSTEERTLTYARAAVNGLAAPSATRESKRKLREAIHDNLRSNRFEHEAIAPLVRNVVDPGRSGRAHGPFGMTADDAGRFVGVMLRGVAALGTATDDALIEARARYRVFLLDYLRDRPELMAKHPTFASWFEEPTMELLFNRACKDVVMYLGMMQLAEHEGSVLLPVTAVTWSRPPDALLATVRPGDREEHGLVEPEQR